jgi:type II secretory pathway predicted ATPase ExeA
MDSRSPFACLLVGQPTLWRKIKLGILAALDQRIALRYALAPMTAAETAGYVKHNLALAGRSDTPVLRRRHRPHPPNQPRPTQGGEQPRV